MYGHDTGPGQGQAVTRGRAGFGTDGQGRPRQAKAATSLPTFIITLQK